MKKWLIGLSFCLVFLGVPIASYADQGEEALETLAEQTEAAAEAMEAKRFFIMPIPIHNPTIGTGLGLSTMYLFQAGENAPTSNIMLGGFWADSKSWAGGIGATVHFKDDKYRLSGWLGYFNVNLEFYGIGNEAGDRGRSVTINQKGPFFVPRVLRRVTGDWYLGAQYRLLRVTSAFKDLPDLPDWIPGDILRDGIEVQSSGIGLVLEHDSRDNKFNSSAGSYLDLSSNFAREGIGSDRSYEKYNMAYNFYHQLENSSVLAWRTTGCVIGGNAPLYDLCMFGGEDDRIRGYVGGQYRDDVSLTTQLEYRWKVRGKWGMVAFAGVGQVASSLSDMNTDNILPSYGIGVRYMASEAERINLGIDYARGKGDGAWYFRISEAF
jgi:outer membrane protein assembly factor BamA